MSSLGDRHLGCEPVPTATEINGDTESTAEQSNRAIKVQSGSDPTQNEEPTAVNIYA